MLTEGESWRCHLKPWGSGQGRPEGGFRCQQQRGLVPSRIGATATGVLLDRDVTGEPGDRMLPIRNDSWIFDPGHSSLL